MLSSNDNTTYVKIITFSTLWQLFSSLGTKYFIRSVKLYLVFITYSVLLNISNISHVNLNDNSSKLLNYKLNSLYIAWKNIS